MGLMSSPTRKAVQINFNPKVQCVVRPDGEMLEAKGFGEKQAGSDEDLAREAVLKHFSVELILMIF